MKPPPLRRHRPGADVHAEPPQVLLRQIHPAEVEVLADVTQEVAELEGET
jgi:hypothetical protein